MTAPRQLHAAARELARAALTCGLASLPGLLPLASGSTSPVAFVSWLALVAPALGYWTAARGVRVSALVTGALLVWGATLAALCLSAPQAENISGWCLPTLAGLVCIGSALQSLCAAPAWSGAGLLWLTTGFLAALPGQAQLASAPLGRVAPQLAARAMDLSPVGLALETGAVDWMRRPAVYEPAGVDWLGDRRPHRAPLAGCVCFVVGFGAALLGGRLRARRHVRHAGCNSS